MEEGNEALLQNSDHPLHTSDILKDDHWKQQEHSLLADNDLLVQDPAGEQDDFLHSYSSGFQNARDTERKDTHVKGQLPEWLTGDLYTVGPGVYDIKYTRKVEIDGEMQSTSASFTFGHWFDGLPLVNRFSFHGAQNKIVYSSRLTNRALVDKIRDHHGYAPRHPAGLFKTSSNQTILSKFQKSSTKTIRPDLEPCGMRVLTTVPGLPGQLLCQNAANHIQILEPSDLRVKQLLSWKDVNPTFKGYTASPNGQVDPRTGEYINFTMEIGYNTTQYHFFSISERNPKGSLITSIAAPIAFVNSFALTPRYIVLAIFPYLADAGAYKFTWKESILDSFSFQRSEPTLFYVVAREKRNVVAAFQSPACFAFHHVNAFEEDDDIFVDIIGYPDDTIIHQLTTENLRHPERMNPSRLASSEVRRYKLSKVTELGYQYLENHAKITRSTTMPSRMSAALSYIRSNVKPKKPSDHRQESTQTLTARMPIAPFETRLQLSIELPQIHPDYRTRKYHYLFGLGLSAASEGANGCIWDSIVKADVETKSLEASWHEPNCYPSEAVFVPRPSAVTEDEGVLLSVVLDAVRKLSFLLVLDAKTMEELARADLGVLIPLSFAHGAFQFKCLSSS